MNISDLLTQEEKDFLIDFYKTTKIRWLRIGHKKQIMIGADSCVGDKHIGLMIDLGKNILPLFDRLGLDDTYGYLYCHFIEKDDEVGFYFRIGDLREKKNTI